MKILLTGAGGYIGTRLLPALVKEGHEVVCLVRDPTRFHPKGIDPFQIEVLEGDLSEEEVIEKMPGDIDAAYYLVHSMSSKGNFADKEALCAKNFCAGLEKTRCQQIIFLSGIVGEGYLSPHLASRKKVEDILVASSIPVTTIRSGIIIGSGSASFEILRDLVEKLPVMVAPKWVRNLTQPIGIADVIQDLVRILGEKKCMGQAFEIAGPDVLTYKELLLTLAKVRGLKRYILTVPVLTPYLSSLWLYFVTSVNFSLAQALVESLKSDVVSKGKQLKEVFPREYLTYEQALKRAFSKIEQNEVASSWRDAFSFTMIRGKTSDYIEVPRQGCFIDEKKISFSRPSKEVLDNVWNIGGDRGWYYANFLWEIRGFIDQLFGGSGIRRGRTSPDKLKSGDALDFWRVILADREKGRLLLYAEMKVPGEAWLEFHVDKKSKTLTQTATFRPSGILGRLYWYSLFPFHHFIFRKMALNIVNFK